MTGYVAAVFDDKPGIVEQLVISALLLDSATTEYASNSVALNSAFISESVNWSVVADRTTAEGRGLLAVQVMLPTQRFGARALKNRADYSYRIGVLTPIAVDDERIGLEAEYDHASFPADPLLPAYLKDFASVDYQLSNTLERRFFAMALQALAVRDWIQRWNENQRVWAEWSLLDGDRHPDGEAGKIAALEAAIDRGQAMLSELAAPLVPQYTKALELAIKVAVTQATDGGGGGGASEQESFLGADPASGGQGGYLSDAIRAFLSEDRSAGSLADGGGSSGNSESPTLKDC